MNKDSHLKLFTSVYQETFNIRFSIRRFFRESSLIYHILYLVLMIQYVIKPTSACLNEYESMNYALWQFLL